MRTSDLEILFVPGHLNTGPDHWQSRWQARLKTARCVAAESPLAPIRSQWIDALVAAVGDARKPVLLVAHSLGVLAVAHAAPRLGAGKVAGAFLVCALDVEATPLPSGVDPAFAPVPREPLPFPSVLVHSTTDPWCPPARAIALATAWGAEPADAGDAGHIDMASGHGPWPEGLLRMASFLKDLG